MRTSNSLVAKVVTPRWRLLNFLASFLPAREQWVALSSPIFQISGRLVSKSDFSWSAVSRIYLISLVSLFSTVYIKTVLSQEINMASESNLTLFTDISEPNDTDILQPNFSLTRFTMHLLTR